MKRFILSAILCSSALANASTSDLSIPIEHIAPEVAVYFDTGSTIIKDEFQSKITMHARHLIDNPKLLAVIAGHADERGNIDSNYSLGLNRAEAVKKQLVMLGVESNRITTVTYGEKHPASSDHQPNRRANIIYKFESNRIQ